MQPWCRQKSYLSWNPCGIFSGTPIYVQWGHLESGKPTARSFLINPITDVLKHLKRGFLPLFGEMHPSGTEVQLDVCSQTLSQVQTCSRCQVLSPEGVRLTSQSKEKVHRWWGKNKLNQFTEQVQSCGTFSLCPFSPFFSNTLVENLPQRTHTLCFQGANSVNCNCNWIIEVLLVFGKVESHQTFIPYSFPLHLFAQWNCSL